MSIERPTANFTLYPNSILDNLDKYTPAETKVINLMVREQLGWSNENARESFSVGYICKKIKMANKTVIKALNGLLEIGTISEAGVGSRGVKKYTINWKDPIIKKIKENKGLTTYVKTTQVKNQEKTNSCDGTNKSSTYVKTTQVPMSKLHTSTPPYHYKKKTEKKKTTTKKKSRRSSSLKDLKNIPQEIISILPDELQEEVSVLKVIQKGILKEYDKAHIIESIEYTNDYLRRGKIKGSYEGLLFTTMENRGEWDLAKVVVKKQNKSEPRQSSLIEDWNDIEIPEEYRR